MQARYALHTTAPKEEQLARVVESLREHLAQEAGQDDDFASGLRSGLRIALDLLSAPTTSKEALAATTPDHPPGNMTQPIHDPAVTTPREVLVGESPVDRIAAPAQEQPKQVLPDELIGKLSRIHKALSNTCRKYGEVGSRDVDVVEWNERLLEAVRAVGSLLCEMPAEQVLAAKQQQADK